LNRSPANGDPPDATAGKRNVQRLMFAVMMTAAIGNTGLQSLLPAVGRSLHVPDWMIALTFSLSAIMWATSAPFWARRMHYRNVRAMIIIGLSGFSGSLAIAALAMTAGLSGWVRAPIAVAMLIAGRGIYGCFGSAAPSAVQLITVSTAPRRERTWALTMLASAFGFGTILGPALAPFLVLPMVGLAGPALAFSLLGLLLIVWVLVALPGPGTSETEPGTHPRVDDPPDAFAAAVKLGDARIRLWMMAGFIGAHAQAIIGQTLGFLIIDRLHLAPELAQFRIGIILTVGATTTLLGQWVVLPALRLKPRQMVIWGTVATCAGSIGLALSHGMIQLISAFAITSLGFGFLRPGYTAGASLAVDDSEQSAVAGRITSNNGFAFFAGPAIGILLYQVNSGLPYLVSAACLAAMVLHFRAATFRN